MGQVLDKFAVDKLMASIDSNNSGKIEYSELLDWYPTVQAAVSSGGSSVRTKTNWKALSAKLPAGVSDGEKAKRKILYAKFDPNGNKYLSLAEVDKGCRDVLELYNVFDAKPVIMRAFQAARSANDAKNKPSSHGKDYIEECEFRLLLWHLRAYFELYEMYQVIDTGGDRKINFGEFQKAYKILLGWGVPEEDPEVLFKEMDKNGGGEALFDEFSAWALKKGLDLQDDDDVV